MVTGENLSSGLAKTSSAPLASCWCGLNRTRSVTPRAGHLHFQVRPGRRPRHRGAAVSCLRPQPRHRLRSCSETPLALLMHQSTCAPPDNRRPTSGSPPHLAEPGAHQPVRRFSVGSRHRNRRRAPVPQFSVGRGPPHDPGVWGAFDFRRLYIGRNQNFVLVASAHARLRDRQRPTTHSKLSQTPMSEKRLVAFMR